MVKFKARRFWIDCNGEQLESLDPGSTELVDFVFDRANYSPRHKRRLGRAFLLVGQGSRRLMELVYNAAYWINRNQSDDPRPVLRDLMRELSRYAGIEDFVDLTYQVESDAKTFDDYQREYEVWYRSRYGD